MGSARPNSCVLLAALAAAASPSLAQTLTTDVSLPGTAFSSGVRGQPIPAVTINRGEYSVGVPQALELSRGSSLRGVAGGLEADTFNWKTRNNSPRAGTLDYLRHSRDNHSNLYITANIRGLVEPDPDSPGSQRFYDTSIPTLSSLAADWVRYTNHIVQTYRQGQTITDARDRAILDSLTWSSSTPGDNFDKLLPVGEAAVPKVKYWEIGNEPRVGLANSYRVTNSYTFFAPPREPDATHKTDFRERYDALTSAMRAEDPTIKVGPALQWLSAVTEREIVDSILRRQPDGTYLPVDFLAYHPYQKLNEQPDAPAKEAFLRNVYADHLSKVNNIRGVIAASGRDPDSIALVASEHNVSNHTSNDTIKEAEMAHALGNTETLFSFARLGIQDAHYWIWPAHRWDGTEYPVFLAGEKLRDHMGDTLLAVSAASTDNLHLYTTRDSASGDLAVWGLNFDDDTAITRATPLLNVGGRGRITLHRLGALAGDTRLTSANLSSEMTPTPTRNVDWTSTDLTGRRLDTLSLTFGSATITLLTIEAWRQVSLPGDVNADGIVNSVDSALITANNNTDERNWWQGDVTGDGVVNAADAAIVSANNGAALGTKWVAQAGNWTTRSNWQGGVVAPNGTGANAYLGDSITAARSITANATTITLGTLTFDCANSYDIVPTTSGTGSLRMAASGSNTARVYVVQGRHRISVPLAIASNTIVDVADDRSLGANDVTITTGRSLTKSGKGTLSVARVRGGLLTVNGGTLAVAPDGGAAGLSIVNGLNVAGTPGARTSTLDLADNDLLVDYATAGTIERDVRELVRDGRLSGFGITSLRTEQDDMILAVADNVQLQRPSWLGQTIDATTIIGAYTFFGDANLDGMVTTDDYVAVDLNLGTGDAWVEGDFDLNGSVTTDDYVVIDLNLGKGTSTPAAWASQQSDMIALHAAQFGEAYVTRLTHVREHGWTVTPVPEPWPFGLLMTAAAGLANRRRKPE